MNALTPESFDELVDAIRTTPHLLATGAGTKPALSSCAAFTPLDMRSLSGVIEYSPDEYIITVQAGTPLREIQETLAAHGQYLPFDPPLAEQGATIGGTVAAGLSGPGRIRYGGVRDFILGVKAVTGSGKTIRGGGKVVKNAAGFDLPKFFVGSQGRFAVLAEITFKVFPLAMAYFTWKAPAEKLPDLMRAANPCDAIEIDPANNILFVRTSGASGLPPLPEAEPADEKIWQELNQFSWAGDAPILAKIPIRPSLMPKVTKTFPGDLRISMAGNLAWVATDDHEALERASESFPGLAIRNTRPRRWYGGNQAPAPSAALKELFDPDARFPSIPD